MSSFVGWLRRSTVLLAAAALFSVTAPARAEVDPLIGIRVAEALDKGDRETAAALIEAALLSADDARIRMDLLAQLAAIESAAGRHAEAARWRIELAGLIAETDGDLSPDLIGVFDAAADDYLAAGEDAAAVEALASALAVARNAGVGATASPILGKLEAIEGTASGAAQAAITAHAEAMRASEEQQRGSLYAEADKGFNTVKIYYATDRARSGSELPNDFYSGQRGEVEYGTATISIPNQHRPGKIEKPSIWTLDFREDPQRHIVLSSVVPEASEAVFAEMQDHIRKTGKAEAFVFVHGFNVSFHEAAKRTAQMAYDMNFEGLPILYSWPSRASILSYIADTAVVNLSGRRLSRFLEDVVARSGATRIHLIAHSMGNRAMTDALELFALRYKGPMPAFDQVLFTAPDLDAGLFGEMVHTIRPAARRITLYASNKDWALAFSRKLHGDSPRAGQGGTDILHVAEVDSIDMTEIGDDMLKHSYYANNPSALTDILSLFWRDVPPEDRCGMVAAKGEHGTYWRYDPKTCDTSALLSTLAYLRQASIASFNEASLFLTRFVAPNTADPQERSRLEAALKILFGG
jgi:esterase/lipase superfamily enzyme